ncbi:sensor histidine kinase [Candidatus Dojkabacteria bacterium]|jgi:signal transduction histidine kinase|uniref:histidine kinase n=1 Tax=Candidatus Dojkabacteria bacterium TaxID=2099670 RepID=A0A3M0YZ24_9BACT|nr:MAG: sensor histidine kinase [Candidatus Dojkabacteria bacterium]
MMMHKISDSELLEELKRRFNENKKVVHDLQILTKKLERMNAKLIESESMKSNFISNIKNELNNPITSVLIMANELATNIGNLNPQMISSLSENLYLELLTIDFNLRNIFMAAEIEAGDVKLDITKVNLNNFVSNTMSQLNYLLKRKNLNLEIGWIGQDFSKEDVYFKTDSEKLQLVLINILWNSIEYSQKNAKIVFNISYVDNVLNFWIRDFGFHMSTDDLDTIFGEFKHLSVDLTKKDRGKSLSLNVSKSLVELLNGTVTVKTNEDNVGCTFTIMIPESNIEIEEVVSDDGNEFFF